MDSQTRIAELREKIGKELERSDIDYGNLVKLSLKLAEQDPEFVRFSVDAGHICRLGKELVGKQETAVAELVKNAFDADASFVELTFTGAENIGGRLEIFDDGHGMTREQITQNFMRLSTSEKIHHPISPLYHRPRAGRKGIGRFAAQRLGNELILLTKTQDQKKTLKLNINWKNFERDLDLQLIANRLEEIDSPHLAGTTIIINDLCDSWNEAQIHRVYRYVSNLIQPFPLSKKIKANPIDPGFKVVFKIKKTNDDKEADQLIDEETEIYNYAVAEIDGYCDKNGLASCSIKSNTLKLSENSIPISSKQNEIEPFSIIRDIHFKAFYYIFLSDLIPERQVTRIKEIVNRSGGIRLYRNGFRVPPYGDKFNDWLRLDASTAVRGILPPHGNNNFIGYVEIYDPEGILFEETASREGLIENLALSELTDFVSKAVKAAVLRVASARDKKQTAGQKDWKSTKDSSPGERVKNVAQKLRSSANSSNNSDNSETFDQNAAADELEQAAAEQENKEKAYIHEIGLLRVLASLGLTIGQFTHEIRHNLSALAADLDYFKENDVATTVYDRFSLNLKTLRSYASFFDSSIAENVRRELKALELRDIIARFKEVVESSLARSGIELRTEIVGFDLFTKPMHPSEWDSILLNFFTNSKKAILRARTQGKILIRAGRDPEGLFLEFADNGDGISPEIRDQIFNAFFTTASPNGNLTDNFEDIVGSGLGLKIVKDIVVSAGGSICVVNPPTNYVTCLKVTIPSAENMEIDQ